MRNKKLSVVKRLIDLYVDNVIIYYNHIDVVFKFHPDLVLPEKERIMRP